MGPPQTSFVFIYFLDQGRTEPEREVRQEVGGPFFVCFFNTFCVPPFRGSRVEPSRLRRRWEAFWRSLCGPKAVYFNAIQCNPMQPNAIQPNAMQCNAIQCNAISLFFIPMGPQGPRGPRGKINLREFSCGTNGALPVTGSRGGN